MMAEQLVSDVGEEGLLALVRERTGPARPGEVWAGDDAAVIRASREELLITTDFMVEGVDFDLSYSGGADIGYKAIAMSVSDLAAMGGFPLHAVVSVALRKDLTVAFFESILDGVMEASDAYRVSIVGGDIGSATEVMVSVTLTGACDVRPVLRSGARPGDAICVTGSLGGSAGGLFALRSNLGDTHPSITAMVERHLRPRPRVKEGIRLANLGVTSMIDISDGFALDLKRLMVASGTGCKVEPAAVPLDPGLDHMVEWVASAPDPVRLGLHGGEDFELLFTIDRDRPAEAKMMLGELGTQVVVVGEVTDGAMRLGDSALEGEGLGWDHLRKR